MHHGERFNAASHLLGLAGATAGTVMLHTRVPEGADGGTMVGLALFSFAALALYAISTAFHCTRGRARVLWERLDHGAIFLLIAGSYTPFALAAPRYAENLAMLGLLWSAAAWAFARGLRASGPPALWVYVVLGWLAVGAAAPVTLRISTAALGYLLLGAAIYSLGTVFYVNRGGWRHAHGVWHLFVVSGTASHFAAVMHLVG